MKMTTEEAFVKVLQMHGIDNAFGIIGSAMMPVSDLFPKAGITFWDCSHEVNAGMMCDGYTRATGKMAMAIAQNGPGITKQHLGQICEPFFTTKAPGSGLGLGLSISSRIMEDLGGKLQATNLATGGACFTVTLPRSTAPEPSTARLKQENQPHA